MTRTQTLQEIRKMNFENALSLWNEDVSLRRKRPVCLGLVTAPFAATSSVMRRMPGRSH